MLGIFCHGNIIDDYVINGLKLQTYRIVISFDKHGAMVFVVEYFAARNLLLDRSWSCATKAINDIDQAVFFNAFVVVIVAANHDIKAKVFETPLHVERVAMVT